MLHERVRLLLLHLRLRLLLRVLLQGLSSAPPRGGCGRLGAAALRLASCRANVHGPLPRQVQCAMLLRHRAGSGPESNGPMLRKAEQGRGSRGRCLLLAACAALSLLRCGVPHQRLGGGQAVAPLAGWPSRRLLKRRGGLLLLLLHSCRQLKRWQLERRLALLHGRGHMWRSGGGSNRCAGCLRVQQCACISQAGTAHSGQPLAAAAHGERGHGGGGARLAAKGLDDACSRGARGEDVRGGEGCVKDV